MRTIDKKQTITTIISKGREATYEEFIDFLVRHNALEEFVKNYTGKTTAKDLFAKLPNEILFWCITWDKVPSVNFKQLHKEWYEYCEAISKDKVEKKEIFASENVAELSDFIDFLTREKCLKSFLLNFNLTKPLRKHFIDSKSSAIDTAFYWGVTPEGHEFWDTIATKWEDWCTKNNIEEFD